MDKTNFPGTPGTNRTVFLPGGKKVYPDRERNGDRTSYPKKDDYPGTPGANRTVFLPGGKVIRPDEKYSASTPAPTEDKVTISTPEERKEIKDLSPSLQGTVRYGFDAALDKTGSKTPSDYIRDAFAGNAQLEAEKAGKQLGKDLCSALGLPEVEIKTAGDIKREAADKLTEMSVSATSAITGAAPSPTIASVVKTMFRSLFGVY